MGADALVRLAAQLYTVREFLKTPEAIAESLRKIREIGYRAVQASGLGPIDAAEFKRLADREGLDICATHVGYEDLLHRLDEVIEKHRVWECKYVGLGSLPERYRGDRAGYAAFAKEVTGIGAKLREAGLTFVYHNHDFEFAKHDGKTGMDVLFEETGADAVDFELDVYWVQAGGADPIEWIRKVDGRMKVVHFKDMAITPQREQRFAEVGEGNMNFRGILSACEEIGVEWAAVEQDLCYGRDPFESLAISFTHLTAMGAKA